MSRIESKMEQIERLSDSREQIDRFISLVDEILVSKSVDMMKQVVQRLLSDGANNFVSKSVIAHIASAIRSQLCSNSSESDTAEVFYELAVYVISSIKQSSMSTLYDETDYLLRDALFQHGVQNEEYTEAAQYLSGANVESTTNVLTTIQKADIFIKCAGNFMGVNTVLNIQLYS